MRFGLWGARADGGGLAAMTEEFYRHLQPDKTLVVDLGAAGRGDLHYERYPDAEIVHGYNDAITVDRVRRFCQGLDVVYAAETFYREDTASLMRECGTRTVLHAMPELWRTDMAQPDVLWVPTSWEVGRMPPGTRIVPVPVPTDRITARPVTGETVTCWHHPAAPAMMDRNGTRDVIEALVWVTHPTRIVFTGPAERVNVFNRHGVTVTAEWRPDMHPDRLDSYPAEADGLLLPRRYAGLSLPMQEAMALGWPIATSDLPPQRDWVPPDGRARPAQMHTVKMVGGNFPVYATPARGLAVTIDRYGTDPAAVAAGRAAAASFTERHSWTEWAPRYRELLEEAAG